MRPRRFDAFPFAGSPTELLLLECRLTELYDVIDQFIVVEANVDHQDHPKPLNYLAHRDRFAAWEDKITYVVAETLPTKQENPGAWAREHAQREWIGAGLELLGAGPDDILMQSDADEIPTVLAARNVNPQWEERIPFHQRGHFWAVDWEFVGGWGGTIACRVGALELLARRGVGPFAAMRDARNTPSPKQIIRGGWHFSWLGGVDAAKRKIGSFCHPEVIDQMAGKEDWYYREGWHVGGGKNGQPVKMLPVDVDKTWPRWMQDPSNVPANWYRPR